MINAPQEKWKIQIICVIVAIGLWFAIISEQNPVSEGSYTVPVVVENLDSQYVVSQVPKNVYIHLSGPRNTIINIDPAEIKAYVDLSAAQEGTVTVPVHIEIPAGTELKKQSVNDATIIVDVYAVQEFRLTPHLVGKLPDGVAVTGIKLLPEKVVASGAKRLLNEVSRAVIEIPVAGKNSGFTVMAPIHLVHADGTPVDGLDLTPHQSSASLTFVQNAASKKVPVNVPTYGEVDASVRVKNVTASPSSVEIRGDRDKLNTIWAVTLEPIDLTGLGSDKEWRVSIPWSTGDGTVEPDVVTVKVETETAE